MAIIVHKINKCCFEYIFHFFSFSLIFNKKKMRPRKQAAEVLRERE